MSPQEQDSLERWRDGEDRRLAARAALILALTAGASNNSVASRFGVSKQTVGKWRMRFQRRRLAGLLDDPRSGAPRRIGEEQVAQVLSLTRSAPPPGALRWTTRLVARTCGLSQTAVSRIWRTHGLSPRATPELGEVAAPLPTVEYPLARYSFASFEAALPDAPSLAREALGGESWQEMDSLIEELRGLGQSVEASDNDSLRSAFEVLQAAHAALAAASRLNAQHGAELLQAARRRARAVMERAQALVAQSRKMRADALKTRSGLNEGHRLRLACPGCSRLLRLQYLGDPEQRPLMRRHVICPWDDCRHLVEVLCPSHATNIDVR